MALNITVITRIEERYNEIKNVSYINETGGYGDNYKKDVIEYFNLDKTHAQMVMKMSYGDIVKITKEFKIPKA